MNRDFWLVKIWENGTCFDLWSLNHFLTGFLLGYISAFIGLNFWFAFSAALFLMVLWEIYERLKSQTQEHICNKFVDVALGAAGFAFSWKFLFVRLDPRLSVIVLSVSALVFIILELWGLSGYRERQKK